MKFHWSEPYHGVTHLLGLRRGFQFSVHDRGSFAYCASFMPGAFWTTPTEYFPSVSEAKRYAERRAIELNAFERSKR